MKRPLDFSQVWVSLLFVQSLMIEACIRVVVWRLIYTLGLRVLLFVVLLAFWQ
jgi:hypothetical protein